MQTQDKRLTLRRGRTGLKLVLLLLLGAIMLSGCTSDRPKRNIQIRIRPSTKVHADEPATQNVASAPTATPTATPVPLPSPTAVPFDQTAEPTSTPTLEPEPVSVSIDAPTPVTIPFGRPDRIVIESVAIDTAIEEVTSAPDLVNGQWFQRWETAAYAAGFHQNSALLGQKGNTVISGHNNIDGAVFRRLYEVEPGEIVQTFAGGYRYDYVVEERFIVKEAGVSPQQRMQNSTWIQTTVDERLTLVSCWPPDGNAYRVIVVAKPVDRSTVQVDDTGVVTLDGG